MRVSDATENDELPAKKMRDSFVTAPAVFAAVATLLMSLELVSAARPGVAECLTAALGSMQGVTRTTIPFLCVFVGLVTWISLRNPVNRSLSVCATGVALLVMISRMV